ncbi:hypothetical protein AALC25_17635 [Lachnospiraceae bacterium 29-84]
MNSKKFSEAMGEIDDKYVEEAIRYRATKKAKGLSSKWIKRGAIAACLCVALVAGVLFKTSAPNVVIAPGFLTVTAYAASSGEEITMQEGIELPTDYKWSLAMSSRPGLPLKLSATEYEDLSFEVSVDGGTLLLWEGNKITYLGSSFNTGNDTTVYWTNLSQTGENDFERYMGTTAYINIVICEEENIVGYAVVEISTNDLENEPAQTYSIKLLKSISFPKVNGEYQKITAEYVAAEMEQIKSETQAGQR